MTVSNEAVENAAAAVYESVRERMGFPTPFEDAPRPLKETYRLMAKAAAPIFRAAAADEWAGQFDQYSANVTYNNHILNPMWTARASGWNSAADWLRARAISERGAK